VSKGTSLLKIEPYLTNLAGQYRVCHSLRLFRFRWKWHQLLDSFPHRLARRDQVIFGLRGALAASWPASRTWRTSVPSASRTPSADVHEVRVAAGLVVSGSPAYGSSIRCMASQLTKALNQPVLVVSLGYMPKP
jgi:hypothetical protein